MIIIITWAAALLVALAAGICDLKKRIVPNGLLLSAAAFALLILLAWVFEGKDTGLICEHLLAGALTCVGLFIFSILAKGGLGMGDVKLFAVLGLLIGGAILKVLFVSLLSAAIYGIFVIALKHGQLTSRLPLAPFSLVGLAVCAALGWV